MQQSSLGLQARKGGRSRERRQDVEGGRQDVVALGELDRAGEHVRTIAVEAEDEAAVDHDAGLVETPAGIGVVGHGIHGLVLPTHVLRRQRLEADEEAAATGRVGLVEVARSARHIERAGGLPEEARAAQHREERAGVLPVGQEVIVEEEDEPIIDLGQFPLERRQRPGLVVVPAPEAGLVAEVAGVRATARGHHGVADQVATRVHQVAARQRHQGRRTGATPLVEAPQAPTLEVRQDLAPGCLGRPQTNRIRMRCRLVGQRRRVDAAQNHPGTTRPPVGRQLVGPRRRRDVGLDPDQVHMPADLAGLDVLIAHDDVVVLAWRQPGQRQQTQRRETRVLDQSVGPVVGLLQGGQDQQQRPAHDTPPCLLRCSVLCGAELKGARTKGDPVQ